MNESKISVRYAKALFQAAMEEGAEVLVMNELNEITNTLCNPDIKSVIQSPVIKPGQKMKLFTTLFNDRFSKLSMAFLELLLKNNRESFILRIARHYKKLFNEAKNIREADITMPIEINDEQKESISNILKDVFNSEIELHTHINPAIIGGFVLKIDHDQYDASIRYSLEKLKKSLSLK